MNDVISFSGKEADLIRKTVAAACNDREFDLFLHVCRHTGLDPLKRQIFAFVFNANDAAKRQLTLVTSIQGYRTIAERTGNYRPGQTEVVIDAALIDHDSNPKGISHAIATVYKYVHGEWHPISERVDWDEFAPIVEAGEGGFRWVDTGEVYPPSHAKAGKPKMRKEAIGEVRPMLDPAKSQWRKMPRVMISKCAEAAALRRAWPDDLSQLYEESEMDRTHTLDLTATELAEQAATEQRLALIGGPNQLTIDWCDGGPLAAVPVGQLGDKALAFIESNKEEPLTVRAWANRNAVSLKEYWARDKAGALAIKKAIEAIAGSEAA